MQYVIRHTPTAPPLNGQYDHELWQAADELDIDLVHGQTVLPGPTTRVRVLADERALHVIFKVLEQDVRSVCTNLHDPVCRDSCVEFFVEPKPGQGYFNFEINCGGTMLLSHVRDCRKNDVGGFRDVHYLMQEEVRTIGVHHSMPRVVDPPIPGLTPWVLQLRIPLALFTPHVGAVEVTPGQRWRGNFYKCGITRPHWMSWAPIGPVLNFHVPNYFQPLTFAPAEVDAALPANAPRA